MNKRTLLLSATLLALIAALPSPAIRAAVTGDPLVLQLRRCAAIAEGSTRLACYDALAGTANPPAADATAAKVAAPAAAATASTVGGAAAAPTTSPTPAPAPAGAPQPSGDADFGIVGGPLQAKRAPTGPKSMLAAVTKVSSLPRGEIVVTLDNGQIWVQLEANNFPVKPGDQIEIDRGALGSYLLWSVTNRRASKVTRIN